VRLDHLSDRLPRQLVRRPAATRGAGPCAGVPARWLLLDEALSNLDAKLRQDVRVEIRELQRKLGLTTVMVTHDQEEALTMADRLVVMSEGRVRQIGSQQDSTNAPRKNSSPISSAAPPSSMAAWMALGASSRPAASSSPAKERRRRRLARAAPGTTGADVGCRPCNGQQLPRRRGVHLLSRISVDLHVRLSPQEASSCRSRTDRNSRCR